MAAWSSTKFVVHPRDWVRSYLKLLLSNNHTGVLKALHCVFFGPVHQVPKHRQCTAFCNLQASLLLTGFQLWVTHDVHDCDDTVLDLVYLGCLPVAAE